MATLQQYKGARRQAETDLFRTMAESKERRALHGNGAFDINAAEKRALAKIDSKRRFKRLYETAVAEADLKSYYGSRHP